MFKLTIHFYGPAIHLKKHYNYEDKVTHASFVGCIMSRRPPLAHWQLCKSMVLRFTSGLPKYSYIYAPKTSSLDKNLLEPLLEPGGLSFGVYFIGAMKCDFVSGSDIDGSCRCPAFCGVGA